MQNQKTQIFLATLLVITFACGNKNQNTEANDNSTSQSETVTSDAQPAENAASGPEDNPSYDPKRGEGKWTAENVKAEEALDDAMANSGEKVSGVKCFSCHKTTDEKLVGPGWKGVTARRKPEWIMNFITNPDPMIDKDPEVQAQLELCLVRMPNQGLEDKDAREILEFMRKNDQTK